MGALAGIERVEHEDRGGHAAEPRTRIVGGTALPVAPYGPDDLQGGIDPRDQVHHAVWAHHLDSFESLVGAGANAFGDRVASALGGMSMMDSGYGAPSSAGPFIGATDRSGSKSELPGGLGMMFEKGQQVLSSGLPAQMLGEAGRVAADGFFKGGDFVLAHGGQVLLDIGGFVPGVNVLTEGVQAGYHGLHAAWDAHEGHAREAREQEYEAAEHAGFALLNLFTGEGGEAAHAVEGGGGVLDRVVEGGEHLRSRMQAKLGIEKRLVESEAIHNAHTAVDVAETGWDTTASVVQGMSGTHVPFVGGLLPWMLDGATDEEK